MDIKTYDKIIDEVYEKYITNDIGWEDTPPKDLFINEIKTNPEFSKKWGLKVEERELNFYERKKIMDDYCLINSMFPIGLRMPFNDASIKSYFEVCDGYHIPSKLIKIEYNGKTIEIYK